MWLQETYRAMFVLDSHCDTPSQIYRLTDIGRRNTRGHVDFPRMKEGGVDGAFFALYVPPGLSPAESTSYALELFATLEDAVYENPDKAAFASSPEEAYANKAKGLTSVFVGIENGSAIQKSLPLLRHFYRMGVRYMTLCHSKDNEICDSCADGHRWGGLSEFGKETVREMNRLGMMIDVSHISDRAFHDVISCSSSPVIASHSCCRALSDHPRNMTDDMLRALAANGGVIQINFYPVFLDAGFARILEESGLEETGDAVEAAFIADPSDNAKREAWYDIMDRLAALPRPSYKKIADHLDHAVSVAGIDHVGLGSDFDGIAVTPSGMDSVADFSLIFKELRERGYSDRDIEKIAGGNFMRVFSAVMA